MWWHHPRDGSKDLGRQGSGNVEVKFSATILAKKGGFSIACMEYCLVGWERMWCEKECMNLCCRTAYIVLTPPWVNTLQSLSLHFAFPASTGKTNLPSVYLVIKKIPWSGMSSAQHSESKTGHSQLLDWTIRDACLEGEPQDTKSGCHSACEALFERPVSLASNQTGQRTSPESFQSDDRSEGECILTRKRGLSDPVSVAPRGDEYGVVCRGWDSRWDTMAEVSSTSSEGEQRARWYSDCSQQEEGGGSLFHSALEEVMVRPAFPVGGVPNNIDIRKSMAKTRVESWWSDVKRAQCVLPAIPGCFPLDDDDCSSESLFQWEDCPEAWSFDPRGDEPMERENRIVNWRDSAELEIFLAELWMPGTFPVDDMNDYVSCIHWWRNHVTPRMHVCKLRLILYLNFCHKRTVDPSLWATP